MVCLLVSVVASPARAVQEAGEFEAKTAFIYAFAKFVTWPEMEQSKALFDICAREAAQLRDALDALIGKRIHGAPVGVRVADDLAEALPCRVLLCTVQDLKALRNAQPNALHGVLTIGDQEGFAESGGILELTFVDDHLGFIINRTAARRAGLELGSSLFNLATHIIDDSDRTTLP